MYKRQAFATLKRGEFSLSPLPLLAHRVVIRRIQLTEPAADLERLADGRANWVFTLPETGEPSPWVLDINEIGFDKGSVGLSDAILQSDLTVLVDPLGKPVPFADVAGAAFVPEDAAAAAPRDYVFGWKVDGKFKNLPTKGEGKVGGMLALQDPKQPFPVQADVSIGGTKAAITGTLTDPANLGALDLRLKLSGGSMAQLYPLTGVTLPDTPPYSTDGHLVARLRNAGGAVFEYRAVSYTHLDVYKRQVLSNWNRFIDVRAVNLNVESGPVSYTHLDVYKRQVCLHADTGNGL